jgi:hypothetical protein
MSYQKTKKYFFDILDKGEQNGLAERIFDIFILALISLNSLAVLVESSIQSANFKNFLSIFEIVSILIFSIEYLIRLWVADLYCPEKPKWRARIRYVFSGMAIVDLQQSQRIRRHATVYRRAVSDAIRKILFAFIRGKKPSIPYQKKRTENCFTRV